MILRLRLPNLGTEVDGDKTIPLIHKDAEEQLMEMSLKGIKEISKVSYSKSADWRKIIKYDESTEELKEKKDNWVIETDGVALGKILAIEQVDYTKTNSNDIIEILQVLGIEACRLTIIGELNLVLGHYGIYVNYRHLSTLVDLMTNRGIITAITRHGINRVDSGALRKCSFEETVEILMEASQHGEKDPLSGVTENIILG